MRKKDKLYTIEQPINLYDEGGDTKESTLLDALTGGTGFDLSKIFSNKSLGTMAKSGLGVVGTTVGQIGGGLIGGGLQSGAGNAISNIGGSIGGLVSAVNPLVGGIISAGTGLIGGLTNRMFGSKLNQENINQVKGNISSTTNTSFSGDADSLMSKLSGASMLGDINRSNIGKDGWFSHKAKNLTNKLRAQAEAANTRLYSNFNQAADVANENQFLQSMYNIGAFGGPLFKEGGIVIKKENRGKFTESANRANMGVQEYARHILANKEDYSPTLIKRANFARNASKWKHAFGGDLNTHGADFTNGQIIIGNGGTHEENPMEGVPMGMDAEGNPNLVEQGEVIFNDYVFSNRLFADGGLLESFNLPKSYDGHSFAAIAEKLGDESKERPNDPISKRGLLSSMSRLQQAQETVRQQTQEGQEGVQYAHGGKMGTLFDGLGSRSNNLKRANFFLEPTEDNYSYNPFIDMAYTDPDENTYDIYKYGVGITPNGEFVETPKYMARAAAKRAGYDVGTSLDDYNKNPIKVPEKKKSAVSRLLSNLDATDLRYAPVIGAAIGLGQNLFSRPDYTSADTILEAANQAGNYTPIGYTPIGNYLQYRPFDRNFYLNKLNAQAGATRRAIMNTTSPSRNAALLAVDYNTQGRLGDLARQAEEYNLAQRQAVETFNRGTNQANTEMGLKAAMANQEAALKARSSRLSGVAQAMAVRDAVDARRGASMSANLTNFFNSLGDIGREEYSRNMIMSNPALYYSIDSKGNVTYKNGYETLSEAEKKEVRDAANKAKKKKKAKGGYLTIKKK